MKLLDGMLDLLFPPKCPLCGKITAGGDLCPSCREGSPWTGEEEAFFTGVGNRPCVAPLFYEESVRAALLRLKFQGGKFLARPLGEILGACILRQWAGQFDVVTWVPVSAQRRKTRGYDQAELLAQAACTLLHRKPERLAEKVRDNPAQSGLENAQQRLENVRHVYAPAKGVWVSGRRILLLDDICTTGSTLDACAAALEQAGAQSVGCAVLARPRFAGADAKAD